MELGDYAITMEDIFVTLFCYFRFFNLKFSVTFS